MTKNIKIIIVTNYLLLCDGIERYLTNVQDISVVGKAKNITEAIEALKNLMPDVLIMDSAMLDTEGQKLLDSIKDNYKSTKVLLLTDTCDEDSLSWTLSMGVCGFLPRCTSIHDMIKAIRKVNKGEIWLGRSAFSRLINSQNHSSWSLAKKLSGREKEVVTLIVKGYSNKDIAKKLSISDKTVKSHLTSIFKKMDVDSRLKVALQFIPYNNHQEIRLKS